MVDFREVPPNLVPCTVLLDHHPGIVAVWRQPVTGRELDAAHGPQNRTVLSVAGFAVVFIVLA